MDYTLLVATGIAMVMQITIYHLAISSDPALDPKPVLSHVLKGLHQCSGAGGLLDGHDSMSDGRGRGRIEDHDVSTRQLKKCLRVITGPPDAEGCCAAQAEQDHPCPGIVAVVDVFCKTSVRGGITDHAYRVPIKTHMFRNNYVCGAVIGAMGWRCFGLRWLQVLLGYKGHGTANY